MGLDKNTTVPIPGIKVLVVDRDVTSLAIITKMLQILGYEAMMASCSYEAITIIEKTRIDLVILDFHMSKQGFNDLIATIDDKYEIPSFAMSADEDHSSVVKSICSGAKLCLKKPLVFSDMKNLWQSVLWRRRDGRLHCDHLGIKDDPEWQIAKNKRKENGQRCLKWKGKEVDGVEDQGGEGERKKRMVWTETLQNKFIEAVNVEGVDASPKKILQYMNVPGLTKQHVSSYLQKYRQNLKRKAAEIDYPQDTNSYPSNLGSLTLPHKGYLGLNRFQVHGNPAYFPTMKTPSTEGLTFGANQLIPQMTLQGTAQGTPSSSNGFKTSSSESIVHWTNKEAPIELSPVESATYGNASQEGALLTGVNHNTTPPPPMPYLDTRNQLLESNNVSFVDLTVGKSQTQCSTFSAQPFESSNPSSVDHTAGKDAMPFSAYLNKLFELDDTSSVDYTAKKSEIQSSTFPANNDMSQQFPQQLPVQPAVAPSNEKKLEFHDAEFVDMDEIFNMSEESMEVYKELGSWLPKV